MFWSWTRKGLIWCREQLRANENFDDVLFMDQSTVQLEQHSRLCFCKRRMLRLLKQLAKHLVKVHIWDDISKKWATSVVIFTGIMNVECLATVYEAGLLPFLRERFPVGHQLQQDNDPKHSSGHIEDFFKEHGVNWWATPPESPDLNPIENIWGSLKQYLWNVYQPKHLDELKEGIKQFWATLTPDICARYIMHLKKVIPKVIEQREVQVDINHWYSQHIYSMASWHIILKYMSITLFCIILDITLNSSTLVAAITNSSKMLCMKVTLNNLATNMYNQTTWITEVLDCSKLANCFLLL